MYWLALLLRCREVPDSNLDSETGYVGFRSFPPFLQLSAGIEQKLGPTASISGFSNDPIFGRCAAM